MQEFLDGLKKYNKPIWLTEFACPAAGQPIEFEINFMKQALALLDNDPAIARLLLSPSSFIFTLPLFILLLFRYAWFGTRLDVNDGWLGPQVDLLAQTSCALTDLGTLYNS